MILGTTIRKHRKANKMTLKQVAGVAGVSEGFLSQVENNVNSPSVDTLVNICNAIGVQAGDLLNQVSKQEKLVVIRKREWKDVDLPHTGFATRRFFPPESRSVLDSAILLIEPGKSIPVRRNIKNGQELLCILKGSLELIHGENKILLLEGDSVHFWSEPEKQNITNKNRGLAIILWIGTI
ncbi:helix-turn-helix domain-containing protein [Thermodesulfobacteriota bacterium]